MTFPTNVNNGFSFNTATFSSTFRKILEDMTMLPDRLSSNDILGDASSLPSGTVNLGTYNHTFTDVNAKIH